MSDPAPRGRAARLRQAFDAAFAAAPPPPHAEAHRLLLVRIGDEACAIPFDACGRVERIHRITPLPAMHPAFRGLTTVGGALLPVYDLGALIGVPSGESRWLLVSAGAHRLAFLVRAIDGYAEVGTSEFPEREHSVLVIDGNARRFIRLGDVVQRLAREASAPSSRSER